MDSKMHEYDRIQLERLKKPQMLIKYVYKENKYVDSIVNFSHSSVCFESKQPLELYSRINLFIIYNKKDIKLKGNVVKVSNSNLGDNPYHVVIQFLAFGTDKRFNSMESYTQLKKLKKQYIENIWEVTEDED